MNIQSVVSIHGSLPLASTRPPFLTGFLSGKHGKLIDPEVTIDFFETDLTEPVALQFDRCKDVGRLVRTVLVFCRKFVKGTRAALVLLDGIARCQIMIFEQLDIELRRRRYMLDIDEPAARFEQGEDLFINFPFARIWLVMNRITGDDRIKRTRV